MRFIKDSCPGLVSTVLLLLLGHIKCCVLPFCLVRNKPTKLHPYPLHTGPLNPQGSKSQQNIIPFNTISWGVFEFNLVPAPLKMTHYSAMMAKLSPIDSAVALKPCCGHSWQVIEREREWTRERGRARAASIVFQVCLASCRQWVSHCEEVEPSHFLLWEQQQARSESSEPQLKPKYIMHSGSLGFLPLFLPLLLAPYDRIRLFSVGWLPH